MAEPLTLKTLRAALMEAFEKLPDSRSGQNTQYTMSDAALAAFSVFFMQSPSFLAYQRDMERHKGRNNAQSLFGVARIPSDPQIRNLLDTVAPEHLSEPFWTILERAMQDQAPETAFDVEGEWLVSLDGTQYCTSTAIHCPQCTQIKSDNATRYAHSALIPVLVKPGRKEVLALEPEFIVPQDGAEKQDCERRAAHRWVQRSACRFAGRRVTILGDDLYCNQPFCELLQSRHLDFILTCKPQSHPTLYEEVALLDKLGVVSDCEDRVWTGRGYERWAYRFAEHVPLREPPEALYVNWCDLTITDETTQEIVYHNAFATNQALSCENVRGVVAKGRARWKVENEGYNVLKNHGYYLEHNFGHGQQHLSCVIIMLILLAFLCHSALKLGDRSYQRVRAELGTRQTFFNDLRALTRYFFFKSWEHLLAFMIAGLEIAPSEGLVSRGEV